MPRDSPKKPLIPFYGTYVAFQRLMKFFKKNGIPRRVTTSSVAHVLGGEASRVVAGLASLSWIDEDSVASPDLQALVGAFDGDEWALILRDVLRRAYPFIPEDLENLTPEKLHQAFVSHLGREVAAIGSAETFFLLAAVEARIPISPLFSRRITRTRFSGTRKIVEPDHEVDEPPRVAAPGNRNESASASTDQVWELLALIDNADMTTKEKDAVLVLLSYLRRRKQKER